MTALPRCTIGYHRRPSFSQFTIRSPGTGRNGPTVVSKELNNRTKGAGATATETNDLDALLPDQWAAAHPEHLLTDRLEETR